MPAVSSILLAASLAASVGGGIAGASANMSAEERARLLQEKGVEEWLKVNVPDIGGQKLALDEFVRTGKLSPQLEQAIKPLDSAFEKLKAADPKLKETRLRALRSLEETGYGGEQVQDAAARQQALIDSGAKSRGQQDAITSSFEQRGQGGSGLELVARQQAAQGEGDRLASQSLGLESDRRMRALKGIEGAANVAGDIEDDQFRRDSAVANARDSISRFNAQNSQNVAMRNVERNNDAARYNLDQDQAIADKNVATRNYEQEKNKALIQQKFQNDAAKAAGLTGQYGNAAKSESAAGQNAGNMWAGISSGIGKAGLAGSKLTKSTGYDLDEEEKNKYAGGDVDYDSYVS